MRVGVAPRSVDRRAVGGVLVAIGDVRTVLTPNQARVALRHIEASIRVAEDPTITWRFEEHLG